jgi:hypothetical protein
VGEGSVEYPAAYDSVIAVSATLIDFRDKDLSEVRFNLNAKNGAYEVVFVPRGKNATFADVDIREVQ